MSYSSDQFYQDWRFAIDKDFLKESGEPFEYAEDGLKEWGQELLNIPFEKGSQPTSSKACALSDDGKYIAVSADFDVVVIDLIDFKTTWVLKGHLSDIDSIAFRPGHSHQLASAAFNNTAGTKPADAQIILWNLNTYKPNPRVTPEAIEGLSRNAANSVIADIKASRLEIDVSATDQKGLAEEFLEPIKQLLTSKRAANQVKIFGRLLPSFQAQVFSPSGKYLIYRPRNQRFSGGRRNVDLRLYDVDRGEDAVTLSGHTDSIMWAGFNGGETLVGTSCWDGSFGIWNAKNGERLYAFQTGLQNWAGGFSPNEKYFAGTSGDGKLHVYNLADGSEHMIFSEDPQVWSRVLSWHPDSQHIALGGQYYGRMFLIDVEANKATQHRLLSTRASKLPQPSYGNVYLTISRIKFVDKGRKIAFFTSGDGSAEVYDIEQGEKWRFARAGTMNAPDDETPVTSKGGYYMAIHEDHTNQRILLATGDNDAVRLWSVPTAS